MLLFFEIIPLDSRSISVNIVAYLSEIGLMAHRKRYRSIQQLGIWHKYLVGFFYGATNSSKCGNGAYVVLDLRQHSHLYWNSGFGTNSRAEVIAPWGILFCAKRLSLEKLDVFRDSKVAIDWENKRSSFNPPRLSN